MKTPKVGDKVKLKWWEIDTYGNSRRVHDLTGTIESINGAYHMVKINNDPKYDVIELYPGEFEVVQDG